MDFKKYTPALSTITLFTLVFIAYSNHFNNPFHFDDFHTIVNNIYIREITNIPQFFLDAKLGSTLPSNQVYRPLTTSLTAFEYWLAGGLDPLYFHIVIFGFFILLIALLISLYVNLYKQATNTQHLLLAVITAGIFGLHPVSAETVNYIIQQADLVSTFFTVLTVWWYANYRTTAYSGYCVIPLILGSLTKPLTIMTAPILLAYELFYFSSDRSLRKLPASILRGFEKTWMIFLFCILLFILQSTLTPHTFTPGGSSRLFYAATQPYVLLSYIGAFFLPIDLVADTDWRAVTSLRHWKVAVGCLFLGGSLIVLWWSYLRKERAPIGFGLAWFFISLIPTSSIIPLAEVKNDHRMFLPFVGLAATFVWYISAYVIPKIAIYTSEKTLNKILGISLISVAILGVEWTRYRNSVWSSEETLWKEVSIKAPLNGRGLMNYGLELMRQGNFSEAISLFERAQKTTPHYSTLAINLGIAYGSIGNHEKATSHFTRALQLAPHSSEPKFYYASYLANRRNDLLKAKELIDQIPRTTEMSTSVREFALYLYSTLGSELEFREVLFGILAATPNDPLAREYELALKEGIGVRNIDLKVKAKNSTSATELINLSLAAYQRSDLQLALSIADSAISLNPSSAVAHNNRAAALMAQEDYLAAKAAAEKALSLDPKLTIAANNLKHIEMKLGALQTAGKVAQ